jgi:hypothetical protein
MSAVQIGQTACLILLKHVDMITAKAGFDFFAIHSVLFHFLAGRYSIQRALERVGTLTRLPLICNA